MGLTSNKPAMFISAERFTVRMSLKLQTIAARQATSSMFNTTVRSTTRSTLLGFYRMDYTDLGNITLHRNFLTWPK